MSTNSMLAAVARKRVAGGGFVPTDIADLRCFEADQLTLSNTDPISNWPEYSAYGATFTAAGGDRPAYVASGINSKPSAQFSGSNVLLSDYSAAMGDLTAIVIFRKTGSVVAYERLLDKDYQNGFWMGQNAGNASKWSSMVRDAASADSGPVMDLADGDDHIMVVVRRGGLVTVSVDNSVSKTRRTSASSTDTTAIRMGGSAGGDKFIGLIPAVFFAPRALTVAEINQMLGYGESEYATPFVSGAFDDYAMWSFDTVGEALNVFTGSDGVTFRQLVCSYVPTSGYCRDPDVWKVGSTFYMAHTDGTFGTLKTWAIASSTDGVAWTPLQTIDLNGVVGSITQVWAPKRMVGDDGVERIYLSISTDGATTFQIYETHPTTPGDYSAWSTPAALTITSRTNVIDSFVLPPSLAVFGSAYEMWFKNETTKYIEVATCATANGTFTIIKSGDWAGWGDGKEGPYVIPISGGHRVYMDRYAATTGTAYSDTTDGGSTWSALTGCAAPVALRTASVLVL